MSATYIHGQTDEREVARLEQQGDWTRSFTFQHFQAAPGHRVLDLACGVGAMSARLLEAFPGIRLAGLDLSFAQLSACRRNHASIPVVNANAAALPFRSSAFDRVYCSWLLEHVADPLPILREVRRVLAPQGVCLFIEVDNWSLVTKPLLPEVHLVLQKLNAAQSHAHGDPAIGPMLHHHFRAAGFRRFTVEPVVLHATWKTPTFLHAFVEEMVGIFESLDESMKSDGPLIARAVQALRAHQHTPHAELRFTPWLAKGFK
jgi:ubiquinone/menaquinone biosynthesis C-methylase UbiE